MSNLEKEWQELSFNFKQFYLPNIYAKIIYQTSFTLDNFLPISFMLPSADCIVVTFYMY